MLAGAANGSTAFSFSSTTYEGVIVDYKIKDGTSFAVRTGTIYVSAYSTTTCNIVDTYGETADVGVVWSVVNTAGTVSLNYTTTANPKTMRASIKYIRT